MSRDVPWLPVPPGGIPRLSPPELVEEGWLCDACGNVQGTERAACFKCGMARPAGDQVAPPPSQPVPLIGWRKRCPGCTLAVGIPAGHTSAAC